MASKRSIPTNLFWDEAFSSFNGETQSIFVGLLLSADDHGRGPASVSVLTRMLAKVSTTLQTALQELQDHNFIQCYQVEGKDYYHICQWAEWERLDKPARSQYPAPPNANVSPSPDAPIISDEIQENLEISQKRKKSSVISEKTPENLSEAEAEENRREEEGEAETLAYETVIPFRPRNGSGELEIKEDASYDPIVVDLAKLLQVPASPALARLVTEFQGLPLLGEADAALAWLADQQGKRKKQQRMNLPFFRRWLQRSQTIKAQSQSVPEAILATGTTGRTGQRLPSLMNLDADRQKGVPADE